MQCPKCGTQITKSNARFCENCGAVLKRKRQSRRTDSPEEAGLAAAYDSNESGVKTYVLRCKSCGGTLNRTEDEDVLVCPYCGSKEIIEESDAVKIEKMRAEAKRERELRKEAQKEEELRLLAKKKYKRSFSFILTVFLLCVSLFGCLLAFSDYYIASGIIAIIQSALFIAALLIGLGVVKPKRANPKNLLVIAAALLIIPYLVLLTVNTSEYRSPSYQEDLDWENYELSSVLPAPETLTGHLNTDSSSRLSCEIHPYSAAQFKSYISACKQAGFTVDINTPGDHSFDAYNSEGYHVDLFYFSSDNYMSVYLDAPIEMSAITWPSHGLAKLIPAPASNTGKIVSDSENYFTAYIGDISKSEYNNYVSAVMDAGFNRDYYRNDTSFSAVNEDSVRISLDYEGYQTMSVRISYYPKAEED